MRRAERAWVICALLALPAQPASAVTQFFTDEASFLAAGGADLMFEGFNAPLQPASIQYFNGFTLAEQGGSNQIQSSRANNVMPSALVEGLGYVFYDDNGNSQAVFNFDNMINAFGIFVASNFDGVVGAQDDIAISGGFGSSTARLIINQPRFWGVIAQTPFSSVTFAMPLEPIVAFDALRYGTILPPPAVPEPRAWALLLAGFALIGFARRRRRVVS